MVKLTEAYKDPLEDLWNQYNYIALFHVRMIFTDTFIKIIKEIHFKYPLATRKPVILKEHKQLNMKRYISSTVYPNN